MKLDDKDEEAPTIIIILILYVYIVAVQFSQCLFELSSLAFELLCHRSYDYTQLHRVNGEHLIWVMLYIFLYDVPDDDVGTLNVFFAICSSCAHRPSHITNTGTAVKRHFE